jgi:hypothetical protein
MPFALARPAFARACKAFFILMSAAGAGFLLDFDNDGASCSLSASSSVLSSFFVYRSIPPASAKNWNNFPSALFL